MLTEPLSLEHKKLLYDKLRSITVPVSEYSFANLYLFRHVHHYQVLFDREIFIKGTTYDHLTYLMPTSDIQHLDPAYLKSMLSQTDCVFPIPQSWLEILGTEHFHYSYKDGDTDYLYSVEKTATYRGRRLHKKRSLLIQFEKLYSHGAFPLTSDRIKDARNVLQDWQSNLSVPPEQTDYYPCSEALQLCDQLLLCGVIYYVEDEPAGFVLGDELNPQTFALHFAKAKTKFKGIYEYIYNTFARILPKKYLYLNFEQDLDKPALRIAKSAYDPQIMIKKYRAHPNP